MRILFAGDTHGSTGHVRTLIDSAIAQRCDRIFVLGDFGYWEHMSDGVRFLDQVSKYAIKKEISVYFLDGNHDKTSLLMSRYADVRNREGFVTVRGRLFYAPRGHQWTWDEVRFIALGGAYSVDKQWRLDQEKASKRPAGTLWFPEEEMTQEEFNAIMKTVFPKQVDVMLAHDKPYMSTPRWNRKDLQECMPNQLRLQFALDALRPKIFLHGHLHFRYADQVVSFENGLSPTTVTDVIGLDCDPWATPNKGYQISDSWHVLDTELFNIQPDINATMESEEAA